MSKQTDKITQCVLIGQSLESDFSSDIFTKVGTISAIDHTINWLSKNKITDVFLFYSKSKQIIQQCAQKKQWTQLRVHLMYMKPQEMKNLGQVMREVQFRNIISQDFLVMYADSLCNFDLTKTISYHFQSQKTLKNVVLTSVMTPSKSSQKIIHVTNLSTGQLLQMEKQKQVFALNKQRINLKKINVEFRRDIKHCQIYLCTVQVFKSFKQTFQYTTMYDFINGMLTSEVYEEKILGYILQNDELASRINNSYEYYVTFMHYVARHYYPYTLTNPKFMPNNTVQNNFSTKRFNIAQHNTAQVARTAIISNNCFIGENTKIQEGVTITKSIIGNECTVKENVIVKNCIAMDKVSISSNMQNCLIKIQNETQKIIQFSVKNSKKINTQRFVTAPLFIETPEQSEEQQQIFEEELSSIINDKPELQVLNQLYATRKRYNKSLKQFTKQIIRIKQPQGKKGVQLFVENWGQIILKVNQGNNNTLIDSLYYSCVQIPRYNKAFHVFLQYFYGYSLITDFAIQEWYKDRITKEPQSETLLKCQAFIDLLNQKDEQDSNEGQSQDEDQDADSQKSNRDSQSQGSNS